MRSLDIGLTIAAVAAVALAVRVAGLLAATGDAGSTPPDSAATSAPASAPADKWVRHYDERVEQFRRENVAAHNIVLVGSSHIEGFDAAKLLPGRRVVNRGIASDRIGIGPRGILHRLDCSVFDCKPDVVVLENGANDLGEFWRNGTPSIDEIDQCYRAVVGRIRERLPDVPLVIVGLFPTRDRYAPLKPYVVEFNQRLERIARDHGCSFVGVYGPFADDDGLLRAEYSRDGLHLTPAGYRLWATLLEKVLPPLDADPAAGGAAATRKVSGEDGLPMGGAPEPLPVPHFPDRLHAFVWRNWEVVGPARIAAVIGAAEEQVREIGRSMGLPETVVVSPWQADRGYMSVIRRNWHLLPYDQLLALLGWDEERLAYTLKEDDFLWIKLGQLKPKCPPLRYAPPSEAARERAAKIRAVVEARFPNLATPDGEPRFAFVDALSHAPATMLERPATGDHEPIRFLYSYCGVYGDPLLDPKLDPYPDGLLARLAAQGVNGVWLHTVLRQLAPSAQFPEFGEGHEARLANLRRLVERAGRYGIKVYLYMNEPRSMPASFFAKYPHLAGAREGENIAMCTSCPEVLAFVRESLAYVFREVPDLGGVFTITASENLTNCWSRGGQEQCERCRGRAPADVVAEVNRAIAEGVWAGQPKATVIVWDWGWHDDWAEAIIRALPDGVHLMSVSEWDLPIERGGVSTRVTEYAMSAAGPGPRATRHWAWARQRGLRTMAKVQVNCTWELSAVPYLPVMSLVAEHLGRLRDAGVDGTMLSWSLGGYPSPNLELARVLGGAARPSPAAALRTVAERRYGDTAADDVVRAWAAFSDAFREYPYSVQYLYAGPMQVGPANLLYSEPTGYHATMVGFPYDDVNGWRGPYPAETLARQLERVADGWAVGLRQLRAAAARAAEGPNREHAAEDVRLAEAAHTYFRSAANQVRFVLARDALRGDKLDAAEAAKLRGRIAAILDDEIDMAAKLCALTRQDARIGYEASNHYYYYPLDLVEKVVECQYLLDEWLPHAGPTGTSGSR